MHNNEFMQIRQDMERLHDEVMSRVRVVRRIKAFLMSPASSASLAIIFILCASIFVSFGDIISNIMMQAQWGERLSYTYSSIIHTRITVQIFALLTSLSCLVLFTKIVFRLRTPVFFIGNLIAERSPLKFFKS